MAQVPGISAPQVNPSAAGTPTQHVETSPFMFGGGLAEGLSGVGSELQQAGSMLAQHAVAFQEINNRTTADQAQSDYVLNHLAPTSADFYQKKGQDAMNAYKPTLDDLEEQRATISASLPNQQTRLLFDQQTRSILNYEARTMSYHVAQQRDIWQDQTTQGQVFAAQQMAILHPNDPTMLAASEKGIEDAFIHNSALKGDPPEFLQMKVAQAKSQMYSQIIQAKMATNSRDAQDFFRQHYNQMDPADIDRIGNKLSAATGADDALDLVHSIVGGGGTANADKLVPLVINKESQGNQFAISGKGAEGIMQLEPDTARMVAKELKLPYDPEALLKNKDYNIALGTQYLKDMIQRYHGNQTLALAAYNAGPGMVDDWLAGTNKTGKNPNLLHLPDPRQGVPDQAFADQIPFAETKDYVAKITQAAGGYPKGAPPTLDSIDRMMPQWQQQLEDVIGHGPHAGDEMYAYQAEKKLEGYVAQVQKGLRDSQRAAYMQLDGIVEGNPAVGQKGVQTQDEFFATPGVKDAFSQLEPPQRKVLIDEINQNAAGPKAVTSDMLEKYHALLGEFRNDPNAFDKEDIAGMGDLTAGMRRELIDRQQSPEKHIDEHIGEAMSVINHAAAEAGLSPSTDISGYNKLTGAMMTKLDEFIAVHNRRPNDSDIMKIGQQLLAAKPGIFGGGVGSGQGGFNEPSKTLYSVPWSRGQDIPDAFARQAIEMHKKNFGTEPNEGQIAYWYTQYLRTHPNAR